MVGANKRRFTDLMVERLAPPSGGRQEIGDELCPGLVLRVTPMGRKTFSVIFKVPGQGGISNSGRPLAGSQHRITLGPWPIVTVAAARQRARDLLSVVTEGRDPRQEKLTAQKQRTENVFSKAFDRFLNQEAKPNVQSWPNIERVMRLHVLPVLGDKPLADIRRSEIHELLDNLVSTNRVGSAREVRKNLSRFFNWAVDREIVSFNPVSGLQRNDLAANDEAGRALMDHEIRALWAAAVGYGYPFGPLYQLLLLTGQRRNEWAEAKRSRISAENCWMEIPRTQYKGRRDHIVPLVPLALDLVTELPAFSGDDHYLFSTQHGRSPVSGFSAAKRRIDNLMVTKLRPAFLDKESPELRPYRLHDLRVTCETRLATLGFNQEVRDAVLGHAKPGLQKVYNKYDFLKEKRDALAAYADHIQGIVK